MRFFDTRPVATDRPAARLAEELGRPWEELEPIVRELHSRRLLPSLPGRWLAVAVSGSIPPLPTAHVFPGGYLSAQSRPNHPHDAPWSVRGLPALK